MQSFSHGFSRALKTKNNLSSSLTVRAVTKDLTTTLWSDTRVPEISMSFYWTTGSQLLKAREGDHSYGWQLLATQPWAPPKKQAPITRSKSVKRGKEGGTTIIILSPHDCETPINAQQNCPKTPKRQNALTQLNIHCVLYTQNSKSMWEPSWSMSKITLALLVVNSVKLHLTAFKLSR